ncbi:Centromere/kinetochore protein zw10 [Mortierella claussenii]|nr:Centromere/kinetochore protein zw10 [Mortierella claussenii]
MAASVISAHSFARWVTAPNPSAAFLTTSEQSLKAQANLNLNTTAEQGVRSTPASSEDLSQAVLSLDAEIQAIKAQVYKKLLANYSAFSDSFEYSLELKHKIDDLLLQANIVSAQSTDPETGLRQKVMSALVGHHEASYKVQEGNAILQGLEHFSRIEDILIQYEEFMDAGKILQAGHCIQHAAKALARPPNLGVAACRLTESLTEQCNRMTEATDQMLDELVAATVRIVKPSDLDEHIFHLELSYRIKIPPLSSPRSSSRSTSGTIRWHELARALTLLDVATTKLKPLQKALVNQLLQPLIQHHGHAKLKVVSSGDYTSAQGSSISLISENGQTEGLFQQVQAVFQYIHHDVFLSGYSNEEFNAEGSSSDTEILTHLIGRNIAKEACAMISKYYLSKAVPRDVEELSRFDSIATAAIQFEDELIAMGFLTEADRELREFVEHVDVHYTNHKRDALLKIGRAVIMSDDFKTLQVMELDKQDKNHKLEQGQDNWGRLCEPGADVEESLISTKPKQILDMILSILNDAGSLNEAASLHLYQATRSLIDLYRSLTPVHHARTLTNVPALAVLFYNDCMYLARELEKIPTQLEDGIPGMEEVQYDDVIPGLKELAEKWLDAQVQKQCEELMQSIDEAGEFRDSSVDRNFAASERAMKQVVLVFKHLGKAWKSTLSPMTFYRILGNLLNDTTMRVIKELEALADISEKESHKLAALCGILFECEDQFDSAGPLVERAKEDAYRDEDPIYFFVPCWEKFQLLTDILELSFAEIMTRFRAGQLHMFGERELSNLVCALFADTPLRQHNLEEIGHGHPMPFSRR